MLDGEMVQEFNAHQDQDLTGDMDTAGKGVEDLPRRLVDPLSHECQANIETSWKLLIFLDGPNMQEATIGRRSRNARDDGLYLRLRESLESCLFSTSNTQGKTK